MRNKRGTLSNFARRGKLLTVPEFPKRRPAALVYFKAHMASNFNLTTIQAYWVLGLIPSNDLPRIARDALSHGFDSKSLVRLAGLLTPTGWDDTSALFRQALKELGRRTLTRREALKEYARSISASILRLELSPYEGAHAIWMATARAASDPDFHDLDPFIYAASEMEDRPQDWRFFEEAIIDQAKRWVEKEEKEGQ
jgi:hypothetical protein